MLRSPYDVLMIIWGLVFVLAWVGFIAVMNHIFQTEERQTEELDRAGELHSPVQQPPLHPAA